MHRRTTTVIRLLIVALFVVAGCAGGTAVVTDAPEPTASDEAWTPPEDLELMAADPTLAYRWDTSPECTLDTCWGMFVVPRDGCSTLYIELTILDRSGNVIGTTNDAVDDVRAGEQAVLLFDTTEETAQEARIAEVSCLRA